MNPPGLRPLRTSHSLAGSVLAALLVAVTAAPAAANPVPVPPEWLPVTFEGTLLEKQRGIYACGRVSVAGWVTIRVERVERGALAVGSTVRVVVGCPDMLRAGQRYRVEAERHGPRIGRWRTYSIQRPIPDDTTPTVWSRRHRTLR